MDIYEENLLLFRAPYEAKRLLDDSITRTLNSYCAINKGSYLTGCANIVLGRVQSVAAFSFVVISSTYIIWTEAVLIPCFLIPVTALNLTSRIPSLSQFKSIQNFTRNSNDLIYRTIKLNIVTIPTILLFLSASLINLFFPGILKSQNIFFNSIHWFVEYLGPLKTIRAVVPEVNEFVGSETKLSFIGIIEEFLRALSCQNYLKEVTTSNLTYHYKIEGRTFHDYVHISNS